MGDARLVADIVVINNNNEGCRHINVIEDSKCIETAFAERPLESKIVNRNDQPDCNDINATTSTNGILRQPDNTNVFERSNYR